MKKVVLVNQSSGYLMTDIANAFSVKYDKTILIAGNIVPNERKLNQNIKVDKIVAYNRKSSFLRIITWLYGTLQIFFKLLLKYRNYFVVYVTNPPFAYLCAGLLNNKFAIIIYDTYPDALINIGIKKSSLIFNWWANENKKLFNKAEKIFTLSEAISSQLVQYTDPNKITIIPNWPAQEGLKPIEKHRNIFVKELHLEDKFIVLYSGNIGLTHNVEIITELADIFKDNNKIHFVIIGEGKKKNLLIADVKARGLKNCTFLTWQPYNVIPYSLASADLALVTLNNETGLLSVPSKTYNLLAVGAPLLCVTPSGTELERIVLKYRNGCCFTRENLQGMKNFILDLVENPDKRSQLSINSQIAAKDFHYSNAKLYVL